LLKIAFAPLRSNFAYLQHGVKLYAFVAVYENTFNSHRMGNPKNPVVVLIHIEGNANPALHLF